VLSLNQDYWAYISQIIISHWYITHSHTIFGQPVQVKHNICPFFSARHSNSSNCKLISSTFLTYECKQRHNELKCSSPTPTLSHPTQMRIVELLFYLQHVIWSKYWIMYRTTQKNCTNTTSIQSYRFHTRQLNYQCKSKCSHTYISKHSSQSSALRSSFSSSLITVPFQDFSWWYQIRVNIHTIVYACNWHITFHNRYLFKSSTFHNRYLFKSTIYRVSHKSRSLFRESLPYVKIYRYNPKHPYPKLNGYGDNGHWKVWASGVFTYCTPSMTPYSSIARARQRDVLMQWPWRMLYSMVALTSQGKSQLRPA